MTAPPWDWMEHQAPPKELSEFPIGHMVAERYEVLEHLGFGGMGFVLKAKDLTLDNEIVVLKILYPRFVKDKAIFARFRREVLLTRRLSHPNIVRIYDLGDAGKNTFFISMEYVEGESLATKLARTKPNGLPVPEVLPYLYYTALGLAYAHSQGIIHRDIKPGNILITPKGEVKIADFGVARSADSKEQLTRTNEAIGSPLYMSPEQLSAGAVDNRSDIYALGIMAYELATGQVPFDSEHWLMLVKMHISDPLPAFASKEKGVPFWYQELANKAAAKEPAQRFQSGLDFAKFIAKHAEIKDSANWFVSSNSGAGSGWTGGLIAPLAVVLLLALVGAGGYFLW